MAETLPFQRLPLGEAYASNTVNATVFRVNALTTRGGTQYATWYAPGGAVVVASRPVEGDRWDFHEIKDAVGNVKDAHNGVVVGVSSDGHLHLAYDHHANPLRYRVTTNPGDIRSFGPVRPMTGRTESRVTYPQFIDAPDGTLLFFYRDGHSGAGRLCLNRYDPEQRGTWEALHHPLIDGADECNPYGWRPAFGPDGSLHVAWCWRDTSDARTNHDICYARSDDGGRTWKRGDGTPQPLPITPANADVADPVPTGSNLLNQCGATVDAQGHPHLAHYHSDASGVPQYVHLWHDGSKWERHFVSKRSHAFNLGGTGTLKIPMSRPEIAAQANGDLWVITRDNEAGGDRIRLYRGRLADRYRTWTPYDVAVGTDLGEWEPTYDVARLRQSGVLSMFVLPCRQGDHETVTDFGPQEAAVLEVRLPK
ncbi:MAG TPA: BNR repeat-containing protein [Armatimonadaceae bacterium]|nr:BNR repeat-containing protein [Armatimonadaceae bacterium]